MLITNILLSGYIALQSQLLLSGGTLMTGNGRADAVQERPVSGDEKESDEEKSRCEISKNRDVSEQAQMRVLGLKDDKFWFTGYRKIHRSGDKTDFMDLMVNSRGCIKICPLGYRDRRFQQHRNKAPRPAF